MPNYKGHIAGGFVFYALALILCAFYYVPPFKIAMWLLCTIAGALFPDIDIKSKGQQFFYKVVLLTVSCCVLYKSYFSALFLCFFAFLPLMVKHRGIFHHLWFLVALVSLVCEVLCYTFPIYQDMIIANSIFFLLGIVSHLWLDLGVKKMLRFR